MTMSTQGLGYDQVLLVPAESHVLPNTVSLATKIGKQLILQLPLFAEANDLTDYQHAIAVARLGGLGLIAPQATTEAEVAMLKAVKQSTVDVQANPLASLDQAGNLQVGIEIWLKADTLAHVTSLVAAGLDAVILYLDTAVTDETLAQIAELRQAFPELFLAVGAIEDYATAKLIFAQDVDAVVAGRAVDSSLPNDKTYPFLTSVMAVATAASEFDKQTIALGGLNYSGDVVKAIAGGANAVILSTLLQGEILADASGLEQHMQITDAVFQVLGGLRSGMGYTGAASIDALIETGQFVEISDNGLQESHPHDVEITKQAPNFHER
ncbi:inosine-5'-monophosphate dehydrogenase [Weissella oryzae SG25]|uniref:Inosine-5'-monophosphate dehydrogenase n=1 Tax=Weissella oryzae (strain DSM 25784 / JCM 18191 / LMG 30913 / SG25) TaxID=1329250 RepID=A0A069CRF4_WEIOS|nr:IMP dehydrogenase [Weissella oryzae]GAK30310.1 inosine-5'-monophosphate dehydrogenase [Weissella oryzae SG25]